MARPDVVVGTSTEQNVDNDLDGNRISSGEESSKAPPTQQSDVPDGAIGQMGGRSILGWILLGSTLLLALVAA